VAANIAVLVAAGGEDAAPIEPEYYRKAVAWDSTLAQRARDSVLGWRLEAELGGVSAHGSPLAVRLTDRAGAPIENALVSVEAIHNRTAHRLHANLDAVSPGAYATRLPLTHPGLWELRFEVTRAGERFTRTVRLEAGS
jgi:hypothetical protein